MHFWKESTSGDPGSGVLRFSGLEFRNTDHTIFAVTQPFSARYFLWGESDRSDERLALGFIDRDRVTMSHGDGQTLEAALESDRCQVFTFRFSRTEGMSIYVNGTLRAPDPTLTDPLVAFPGAQLGAAGPEFVGSNAHDQRFVESRLTGRRPPTLSEGRKKMR